MSERVLAKLTDRGAVVFGLPTETPVQVTLAYDTPFRGVDVYANGYRLNLNGRGEITVDYDDTDTDAHVLVEVE